MENLKKLKYDNTNVVVYVKTKDSKKFMAMSSIKDFTVAPNLMYAALFPIVKLNTIKEYLDQYLQLCKDTNTTFQIRGGKERQKVLYQVN